jgi:hypothetical protein
VNARRGRGWAYTGAVLGGLVSVAANVAHSYVPPAGLPASWAPKPGAVALSIFWPVALFIAVEICARVDWNQVGRWAAVRWIGIPLVGLVAAVVSYRHLSGLLGHYGEDRLTQVIGPLAVDGLMLMATAALIATGAGRTSSESETVTAVTVDDEPAAGPGIRIDRGRVPGHVVGLSADYPPVSGYPADTASARPDTRVPEPVSVQASGYPPVSADTPDTTEAPSVRECVRAALSAHGPDMTRILPDIQAVHPDAKPDTVARYVRQLKGEGGYV